MKKDNEFNEGQGIYMLHIVMHSLEHGVLDCVKLLPLLFLTYLAMEALEHKAGDKAHHFVKKAGKFGPVIGGVLGAVPQCGFSTAASNLFAGRVITIGTLIAIFLSTSDEMIPIMISAQVPVEEMLKIVAMKVVIGMAAGFGIDFIFSHNDHEHEEHEHDHIHEMCEHEHCNCEKGIVRSAAVHTFKIFMYILVITIALNLVIELIGEDTIASLLLNRPVLGPVVAGIVGLIPNCASSVLLTQLYIAGTVGVGTMMAGLCVNAGMGLLVLFHVNPDKKENCKILGLLYVIGVLAGIMVEYVL